MLVVFRYFKLVKIQIVDGLVKPSLALLSSSCLFIILVIKSELLLINTDFHFTMSESLVLGRAEP